MWVIVAFKNYLEIIKIRRLHHKKNDHVHKT